MPVPEVQTTLPSNKDWIAWPRIAAISAMVAFSLPTFITGLEVSQSLSVQSALIAMLVGCVILTLIGGAMGTVGVQTRMSSYQLVRIAFGDKGAAAINLAFALSLLGWFGVNIDLFSGAVVELFKQYQVESISGFAIELIAGALMTLTTIIGFSAINRIASWMVPVIALVTLFMLYNALQMLPFSEFLQTGNNEDIAMSQGVSAIVGAIIIGAIILPDITRFSRQARGAWHTAFWSYLVVQLLVMVVAAWSGAATGNTDILQLMLAIGLGVMAFAIVICGSWVLNSLNLYSTCLSIGATWPKAQNHLFTGLLGLVGIVAASFDILDYFIGFLVILSAIFVPVAGVILIDYFLLYKPFYCAKTLNQSIPFSWAAAIAWFAGASLAVADMFYAIPTLTGINVLDAILLCGLVYWGCGKMFFNSNPPPG
ncbi:purine-cytosine permease family protein [Planctobacterium marinum]|uniref:Cytosine permease n=1 Tax=Planctobacterium marinum TaxID=1631968 RepID=A0AA48HKR6_9ALTE|nr:cytosine permease [Planctobacterium marinum]